MLYIAILPSWLLLALVVFTAAKLIMLRQKTVSAENIWVINLAFFITFTQYAVSLLALYFTYESSISWGGLPYGNIWPLRQPIDTIIYSGAVYFYGVQATKKL